MVEIRSRYKAVKSNQAHVFGDVYVNSDTLIFKRGRIYPESFAVPWEADEFREPRTYTRFLLKNHWLRRGADAVPSALWVIDRHSTGYYHWMIDSLTRLLHAEEWAPDVHVLLLPAHYRRLSFVAFTMQAFPQIQRIEWMQARTKKRVHRLTYIPRVPRVPMEGLPDHAELRKVAERVRGLAGETGCARRIYFSRDDAWRRRVRNEEEVVRVLRAHDFEILRTDPARPWEQVRLSSCAEFGVGMHGAALANMIFMRPGSRVLEFRNLLCHPAFYEALGQVLGVRYRSQKCTGTDKHGDFVIDLDELRENLSDW